MDEIAHITPRQVEDALCKHPGVRRVQVVANYEDGQVHFRVLVEPDPAYVERLWASSTAASTHIQRWRKTFDLTQLGKGRSDAAPDFNIAGWNSSFTKRALPEEDMREWVDATVAEILVLQPKTVLEIGCGTGLLLLRIAPRCDRYVGSDLSGIVLKKLQGQMKVMQGPWEHVTLIERGADNFEGFAENSFDTAVVNSVVHYFPGVCYLNQVLEGLVRVVRPGGRIFIGDIRSLPLLQAYATAVQLHAASPEMSLAELRDRIHHHVEHDQQLVISPAFFFALQKLNPKISHVAIKPRRGRRDNEMNRFRYNAILHLDSTSPRKYEIPWQDCANSPRTLDQIGRILQEKRPELLGLKNIANARIAKDVRAAELLRCGDASQTVADLVVHLRREESQGIDLDDLCLTAGEAGYRCGVSWAGSRPDGSYDAAFVRNNHSAEDAMAALDWPEPEILATDLGRYVNAPGQSTRRNSLLQELAVHCQKELPDLTIPLDFAFE